VRIGGENGGENGGGNGTLDKGGGNRGTVGMEVWEGSLLCLDEITLQIPITTCAIVESDQHGPAQPDMR